MNRLSECDGKQAHSFAEADKRIRDMRRRFKAKKKDAVVRVYRCPCCRQWHIGSADSKSRGHDA